MKYRVGEFAALTGVTVRALQHYDRMGLLSPARTESGHRVYSNADQRRVRHILALRAVGMSLQRIAEVLDAAPGRLPDVFRAQRARLEESRIGIEQAIRTLRRLEVEQRDPSRDSWLDRLTADIDANDVLESMRSYFSDDAWSKWGENYFYDWPSPAWRALFRDVEASLNEDPDSERGRDLLARWTTMWRSETGSEPALVRAIHEGYGRAWRARDRWPTELQRRYAEFRIEEIARFLGDAAMASWRRSGLLQTYTVEGAAAQPPGQPGGSATCR